jgi:hypothetical protein
MTNEQPNRTLDGADEIGWFQLETAAAVEITTSQDGKVLARQFTLSNQPSVGAKVYPILARHRIVNQIRLILMNFYVNLERKKSQYGFDPVRALDLLGPLLESSTDAEFHQTIVQLVARTRDRHLTFRGWSPLGFSAVLPLIIERCLVDGTTKYVVSKITPGFPTKNLKTEAIVTHWNGIPIERFVRLNANIYDGGNEASAFARSLAFLTQRPLDQFATPLEEWVDLRFSLREATHEERFAWQGFAIDPALVTPPVGRTITGFGGDIQLLNLQRIKQIQFAITSFDPLPAPITTLVERGIPNIIGKTRNFDYGSVTTDNGTFGYVRLWHFGATDPDDIAKDFITAFQVMPRNGLIIDMRGNAGGYIAAGERCLQLFTPSSITPTRFQFRVTTAIRRMIAATNEFGPWKQSIGEAFATGEFYTQGFPIEGGDEDANRIGQKYFGPVVLITDALAYSTADMFAAGFIDHNIGRVVCIDKNMAAAGGNNWQFDVVRLFNPDFQLDGTLKAAFDAGTLSIDVKNAFNREGVSLSDQAELFVAPPEYDGLAWRISDGVLNHTVRYLDWMNNGLNIYLDESRGGLANLPGSIDLGVTMRRCVRVGKNEGRLLEDLGIEPDVVYEMTLRDVMDRNQDLIARAAMEFAQMPVYDFDVEVVLKEGKTILTCRTLNLTSIEVSTGQRYLASAAASNTAPCELVMPPGVIKVGLIGFSGDSIVAKTIITF